MGADEMAEHFKSVGVERAQTEIESSNSGSGDHNMSGKQLTVSWAGGDVVVSLNVTSDQLVRQA
jgi:hypothetical protein